MSPELDREHDDLGTADVSWLAWRYLLDELDADADAAFERRLAHDEAAAAAVAEAARLVEAVAGAASVGAVIDRPPVRRHWLPVAAACAALVAGILLIVVSSGERPLGSTPVAGSRAAELVRLWSSGEQGAVGDADDPHGIGVGEEGVGDEVPGWLLTAVTLDHDRRAAAAEADDEQGNELL